MGCKSCNPSPPPPLVASELFSAIQKLVEQLPCPQCGGPMEVITKDDRDTGKPFKIWYCLNRACDYREKA
jgi:hypothetical protein